MEAALCQHFKTGYCKFEKRCKKHHESEICFIQECDINYCNLRHPRICKYFASQQFCKFGHKCAYRHVKVQQKSDTDTQNIQKLERELEMFRIEISGMVNTHIDEKTMQVEVKQIRCEMIKLKLDNKLMAEKICALEETNLEHEVEQLKVEIEKLIIENENKEHRITNLEYHCGEESDSEESSQGENEENETMTNLKTDTNKEILKMEVETEVNQNFEEYTRGDLNDEELEEWFEVESGCGEVGMYKCNFCDLQIHEYDMMKEHLISKHREAIVTLSTNSAKYLDKY